MPLFLSVHTEAGALTVINLNTPYSSWSLLLRRASYSRG